MAWNEPGKGKDPWSSGGGSGGGPPDLDEIARNLQRRLSGMFGKRPGGPGNGNGAGASGNLGGFGAGVLILIAIALWLGSAVYKIDDAERGVVLRFGAYEATTAPGLHWHIPWPIETVEKVNVASIDNLQYQTRMLTSDENIVRVNLAVQFRREDPQAYLFNVREPDQTLRDVSESAIREVVGKNTLDFVLTEGRTEIAIRTRDLIQQTLDNYGTGIRVTAVNLQDANFPDEVQVAVQDAIKAREDKDRKQLEAQAYANNVVPTARGLARRELEDAAAYRDQVIANSQGETARFLALLQEYEKAPEVTRERLYLETIEEIYGRSSKVMLDADGSGNLIYLPVDKLMEGGLNPARRESPAIRSTDRAGSSTETTRRSRDDLRSRGNR